MSPAPPVVGSGGMDLTALRAAALQSKKRKAEALEAALAAAEDAEMEEGEIPDDGGKREHGGHVLDPGPLPPTYLPPPPPPPRQSYQPQQSDLAFVPPPASHIHAIREEAKDIIGELLSYGVSPEYLLGVGISKDIVAIAFHELGFRLPTQLAHLAPPAPPHYIYPAEIYLNESRRNSDTAALGFEPSPPLSPRTDPERSPSPAPAPAVHSLLAEMEARTRKQLMERKAALASRNSEQAQLLQDELERTLFASFADPPPPPAIGDDDDGESLEDYEEEEPSASEAAALSKASDDASAASVGHLRAAIDSSEQVVYTPSGGPFAHPSLAGSQTPTPVPTPRARPVAADFVDSNYREDAAQLVIELSDSEGDDDDQVIDDKSATASFPALRAVTALGPSRSAPATPVHSPPVEARRLPIAATLALAHRQDLEATGGSEAKKRLEEKEDEIKKIMRRIQRMEDRKKNAAAGPGPLLSTTALSRASSFAPGSASPSTPRSPVASSSRLPSPVAEAKQIEQAKEQIESLEKERQDILDEATLERAVDTDDGVDVEMTVGDEAPPTNDMLVDTAEPQAPELPTSLPPVSVPPVGKRFSEYKSPFEHLSLSRSLQPLPPVARPITTSSTLATSRLTPTPAQDDEAVRAWVAQKRGVDASKRLCQYDTEGGTCSDKACKSNHVSGYRVDDDDIVSYVLATSGLGTGEKRDVFARGLTLALDRLPRPLTLDTARRAAFILWQESHPASIASST